MNQHLEDECASKTQKWGELIQTKLREEGGGGGGVEVGEGGLQSHPGNCCMWVMVSGRGIP